MDNTFLLLAIIVLALFLLSRVKSSNVKGARGEHNVVSAVNALIRKGLYGHVIQNAYIPRRDGSTSEVDIILVCVKGIFVFESKNYAGYIFGDDQHKNWTVSLYAGKNMLGYKTTKKHSFYNPVWQNRTHIRALQDLIGSKNHYYSVIVFSNRCELKNVSYDSDKVTVLQWHELRYYLQSVRDLYPDALRPAEVDRIADNLSQYTGVSKDIKQAHLESIRQKKDSPEVCPWCGSRLIVRTAKKGPNAGRQFYGCSNYPKCKYIRNIYK